MGKKYRSEAEFPAWAAWFAQHGFTAVMTIGLGGILVFATAAYWFDRRLENIEGQMNLAPPKSYQPPNLAAYVAPEIPESEIVREQSVYVPVYSHVYSGGGRPFLLETTLSIRNTHPNFPVYVRSVRYYDTDGELVKEPVDRLIKLKPLQTIEFLVPRHDSSGGSGANFFVDWLATDEGVQPDIEAAMVGNAGAQGISFRAVGIDVPAAN